MNLANIQGGFHAMLASGAAPLPASGVPSGSGRAVYQNNYRAQLVGCLEESYPLLRTFIGEQGQELFDLPRAPRPDPGTPAPPRLVAEWDNLLLSHADRSRVMSEAHRARVFTANGIVRGTVLLDGLVAGVWKIERAKNNAAAVVLEPFTRWPKAGRLGVEEEALRLLAFAADGEDERHEVRVL